MSEISREWSSVPRQWRWRSKSRVQGSSSPFYPPTAMLRHLRLVCLGTSLRHRLVSRRLLWSALGSPPVEGKEKELGKRKLLWWCKIHKDFSLPHRELWSWDAPWKLFQDGANVPGLYTHTLTDHWIRAASGSGHDPGKVTLFTKAVLRQCQQQGSADQRRSQQLGKTVGESGGTYTAPTTPPHTFTSLKQPPLPRSFSVLSFSF